MSGPLFISTHLFDLFSAYLLTLLLIGGLEVVARHSSGIFLAIGGTKLAEDICQL
jgi:hypothetical protein